MKDILIDLYKIKNINTGLGRFSVQFAEEIIKHNPGNINLHFLVPQNTSLPFEHKAEILKVGFQQRYFPLFNKKYHIWHSLNQFPSHFPRKGSKHILTVHDLNFLIEKSERKKKKYLKILQNNVNKADVLTTISHYSKQVIQENINVGNKEIHVVHNGVKTMEPLQPKSPNYAMNKKFFFSISLFTRKKNFHVLLPMMQYFNEEILIIAGNCNTKYGNEIKELIARYKLEERVILIGEVSEEEKFWLYKHCEAFLFPSIAEGFGIPVIEAMRFGKPVFLSKYTSLPEIGGEEAYYFDDFEPENLAKNIKTNLMQFHSQEQDNRSKIKAHAEMFEWINTMSKYLDLYNMLLS